MECRKQCGACCIAPSISTAIPQMPRGKPAGQVCVHLNEESLCGLFGTDQRPRVCSDFKPIEDVCGETRAQAMAILTKLEELTRI